VSLFAWSGAVAFALSLAYLVYFYAVVLAPVEVGALQAASTPTLISGTTIDAALFSVFAVHHSVMARARAKRWLVTVVPSRMERPLYVWISSALAVAMCLGWQPIGGLFYEASGGWRVALHGAQAMGLALTLAAARVIDPRELAGIRPEGEARSGGIKATGPFGLVRHPIYLGWVLMVFGTPAMTGDRLLFATISTTYLILAIPWEERSLAEVHGEAYREYQRTVKQRLVPWVW
jgi:protein-S-isoprenylcysteine O-methyltransferase Ste14